MGKFIVNSLEEGENVVLQGRLHWTSIAQYIASVAVCASAAVGFCVGALMSGEAWMWYIAAALAVVALVVLAIGSIVRTRSEFAVTNSRFIQKDGILNIKMTEIPLYKIETVNFYQSLWQRLLNTGSIELVGSGGTFHRVSYIEQPLVVRRTIVTAINAANTPSVD